jgi:hypothetical protein
MNTVKSIKISLFALAVLFFCGHGNVADAQDGSGKATTNTTTTTPKTKSKPTKTVTKTTKPKIAKTKKIPDPPLGDWEINNMIGRWEGLYKEGDSTLEIERFEGYTFYGYFTRGEFKIAFTGVIDKNRKVVITETEVLSKPANRDWALGVNNGELPYACLEMKGTGKGGNTVYTWSYGKIID